MDNGAGSYRRFLDGDDEGIVEIIRDYKDGLILFLNGYVRDIGLAEELAEDTFFRLVTRKPRFKEKYSFKTWLYTIGRNLAVSHIRQMKKSSQAFEGVMDQLSDDEADLEKSYLTQEQRITVHRALSRIRPEYGQALYLKFFEELTNEQIAHVQKKSRRQVENLIYQAKQSLKRELEKEGFLYEGLS